MSINKKRADWRDNTLLNSCLPEGFIKGLIGPNGSGKTTAIKYILIQNNAPTLPEIERNFLLCAVLFCVYAGIQIPGYYRFGSIKGRIFIFVPAVGFLLIYYIVRRFTEDAISFDFAFLQNRALLLLNGIGFIAFIIMSVAVSIKILQKNVS